MKANLLLEILRAPNSKFHGRDYIQQSALDLGYKMFAFNGIVYNAETATELFKLSDLIDL